VFEYVLQFVYVLQTSTNCVHPLTYHRSTCLPLVSRHFHRFDRDSLIRRTFEVAWHERKPVVGEHSRALDSLISFAISGLGLARPRSPTPQTRCVEGMEKKKFRWLRKFALLARPIFESAREKNSRSARQPDRRRRI